MKPSINVTAKKRGRPKSSGTPPNVGLRLHADLLAPLDRWIAAQPQPMTRPEAIRYALRDWLINQGVIKTPNDREDLN